VHWLWFYIRFISLKLSDHLQSYSDSSSKTDISKKFQTSTQKLKSTRKNICNQTWSSQTKGTSSLHNGTPPLKKHPKQMHTCRQKHIDTQKNKKKGRYISLNRIQIYPNFILKQSRLQTCPNYFTCIQTFQDHISDSKIEIIADPEKYYVLFISTNFCKTKYIMDVQPSAQ